MRVNKCFKYQAILALLLVALFIFKQNLSANASAIIINELQTAGVSANDEFIELYNTSSSDVNISNWSIQYRGGSSSSYYKKNFESGSIIPAKGYFLIAHGGSGNYSAVTPYNMSWSQSLSSTGGTIYLVNNQILLDNGNKPSIVDKVAYGLSVEFEVLPARKPQVGQSIERKNFQDTDNNNADFDILEVPTPQGRATEEDGEENNTEIKKEYPSNINITELFPNPFESEYEEYIELYNGSEKDVDLRDWSLHDASKSGKYTFPENMILKAKEYLAIFKKDFKFALNNSGSESVYLIDPNGQIISSSSYDGSKKNVSYNFNGLIWKWSKFLTPGKENIFNNEPNGKVKMPDDIYENVYADFSISVRDNDGEKVKVTWDFGDGHKSYLAKTHHKYNKRGKYDLSVKLSDGSEDVIKNFEVKVHEMPHPKVRITFVNPNPEGSDTENETITIENKSKKKINLLGWSIATGWKKFINHPVREDFIIEKGKSKIITREISSFTLNNKKDKIELRYPDGKVAYKLKYKKEDGIGEGEVYKKVEGGWIWEEGAPKEEIQLKVNERQVGQGLDDISDTEKVDSVNSKVDDELNEKEESEEIENESPEVLNIEMLKNDTEIEIFSISRSLRVREEDGKYLLSPESHPSKHYAVVFFEEVSFSINSELNSIGDFFLE